MNLVNQRILMGYVQPYQNLKFGSKTIVNTNLKKYIENFETVLNLEI